MKPAVVFPLGLLTEEMHRHLLALRPALAALFARAYVSLPNAAEGAVAEYAAWVAQDDFFRIIPVDPALPVGDRFRRLYRAAAKYAPPEQILHLCYLDRLAFILQSAHRLDFRADIRNLDSSCTPLIFQRSEGAWATHPENYRAIEGMVARAGELLFGRRLDYAWCHFALPAGDLRNCLPESGRADIAMVAEIVLALRGRCHTKDVDWLAWEDPFILGREPAGLKKERENSPGEVNKRFAYAIPMLQLLYAAAQGGGS